MKDYVLRKKHNSRIEPFIQKGIIKVLIGQRRVGKSYLLKQVMDNPGKNTYNGMKHWSLLQFPTDFK
jgi:predicted AAA+ superfamily ATPase